MWLLDVNLLTGLLALLRGYGISCDTTANRGWRDLTNGFLAETAFGAGFRVIPTRDRLFGESVSRALRGLPRARRGRRHPAPGARGRLPVRVQSALEAAADCAIVGRVVEWP